MPIIKGTSTGGMTLQIDYSVTQNTSNNTSTVKAILQLESQYALYATALSGSYISVGGNKENYSTTVNYSGTTTTTTKLAEKEVIVPHNNDGTATCNLAGTFVMNGTYRGNYVGTMSVNQTVTLSTIPRSSGITKITNGSGTVISTTDTKTAFRVYWKPASTAFKYKVQCVAPGYTYTSDYISPNTTNETYTTITSAHSWLPTQTSSRVTINLYTYNSSNVQVGNTQSSSITLNVPTNVVPNISSVTTSLVNGINGRYVEGNSKVLITVNATKGEGAANIINYTFSGNNINTYDGSNYMSIDSNATTYYQTSSYLKYAGGGTYSVTVTDTRGRSTTKTLTDAIVVHWYGAPTISSISAHRCDANGIFNENGRYAKVVVYSSYAPIDGANTRTVVLSNSSDNYVGQTIMQYTDDTNTAYSFTYGDGNGWFEPNKSYTIRATITDTAYKLSDTKSVELAAAARTLNILKDGSGIGIGKIAETSQLLDVAWNTKIGGNLTVNGTFNHFGVGGDAKLVSGNWNTACGNESGFFRGRNLSNAPNTYTQDGWWYVHQIVHDVNFKIQLAYSYNDSRGAYKRLYISGTWSAWQQFVFDNSFEGVYNQSGYTRLPNGVFLQWGLFTTLANQYSTAIKFPIAFPNYARSVICQHNWDEARHVVHTISHVTKTGFDIHPYFTDSNAIPHINSSGYWFAIGH